MARYYGTIQGHRGMASRVGHRNSGFEVTAQSYQGDITVDLIAHDVPGQEDVDLVSIYAREHGLGNTPIILYYGPIKHLINQEGHDFLVNQMATRALEKENKSASE